MRDEPPANDFDPATADEQSAPDDQPPRGEGVESLAWAVLLIVGGGGLLYVVWTKVHPVVAVGMVVAITLREWVFARKAGLSLRNWLVEGTPQSRHAGPPPSYAFWNYSCRGQAIIIVGGFIVIMAIVLIAMANGYRFPLKDER